MNNQTHIDFRLNNNADNISNNQNSYMDRLRLSNIMSQADIHPFWTYGQFMSPVCPPPGLAMFQSPSLPYPLPVYQPNNIPSFDGNLQLRTTPNTSSNALKSNEANNVLVQIGLQCVNQNNPVNINSLNDLSVPVGKPASTQELFANNLDNPFTSGTSPNSFSEKNNFDSPFTKECYEKKIGNRCSFDDKTHQCNGNLDWHGLSQDKFTELTRLAMRGSELAERLAYTHRNRPCFKKIDSLCARMKQDLIRPDGVLPNINSQGIAWAVKDFIFVFTRVINAWIIIKGYVYNTPEGLNKVKSALSPDFIKSFAAWQDTTMNFVENLIKSFVNLDQLVQNQKAAFQKMDTVMKTCSTPLKSANIDTNSNGTKFNLFDDSFDFLNTSNDSNGLVKPFSSNEENCSGAIGFNKSYFSTLIEDSEESQRKATANGTYFKTGVYNPLQKDSNDLDGLHNIGKKDLIESNFDQHLGRNFSNMNNEDMNLLWQSSLLPPCPAANFYNSSPVNGEGDGKLYLRSPIGFDDHQYHQKSSDWLPYELHVLENNLSKFAPTFDPTIAKPIGADLTEKLEMLLERISNLSEGKYFFTAHFTRNYFPDFTSKYPKFMDLRSIILKAQIGGYGHIYEIVHDLKLIIHHAKIYLQTSQNDLLKNSIFEYEKEIDNILREKIFRNWTFDHITGDPSESVYIINNNNRK